MTLFEFKGNYKVVCDMIFLGVEEGLRKASEKERGDILKICLENAGTGELTSIIDAIIIEIRNFRLSDLSAELLVSKGLPFFQKLEDSCNFLNTNTSFSHVELADAISQKVISIVVCQRDTIIF